jgi:hypothetical protein
MVFFRIAFSIGFLLGPIIGALFSIWARNNRDGNEHWYAYPAAVALSLSLLDLVIIDLFMSMLSALIFCSNMFRLIFK